MVMVIRADECQVCMVNTPLKVMFTQHCFHLKTFYAFWPFIYTTRLFWGLKNASFWKRDFKVQGFEKMFGNTLQYGCTNMH